jgi:hypothetical protein
MLFHYFDKLLEDWMCVLDHVGYGWFAVAEPVPTIICYEQVDSNIIVKWCRPVVIVDNLTVAMKVKQ